MDCLKKKKSISTLVGYDYNSQVYKKKHIFSHFITFKLILIIKNLKSIKKKFFF